MENIYFTHILRKVYYKFIITLKAFDNSKVFFPTQLKEIHVSQASKRSKYHSKPLLAITFFVIPMAVPFTYLQIIGI